jgi:16S rRNA (uracil1498-N3)-methyltransferase
MHRFHLPNLQLPTLTGDEAHHATHVLRLKLGDTVSVFDGRGREAQCRIEKVGKDSVRLAILQHSGTPPLPCRITLAQAIPKKNMNLIVQKATELGVATIVPLVSERTVVKLDDDAGKLARWREIALESCKQCGNNWLPEIQPPQKVRDFLASPGAFDLKLIGSLQPDAKPLKKILAEPSHPASVLVLIGPEGDFTPAELGLAKSAGCLPLSLGPLVLRADTAALYVLSILHHELQNR